MSDDRQRECHRHDVRRAIGHRLGWNEDVPPGPLVIYWYATGSSVTEATEGLDVPAIVAAGGVVAAQNKTTSTGTNTGDGVWYTGDLTVADQVVACAIAQNYIDPTRIHAAGYSAGGLQTAWMSLARANYMASVISYSGGITGAGGFSLDPAPSAPDVAAAIVAHGQMDTGSCSTPTTTDCLGEDFYTASHTYETNIKGRGGFSIDCDNGGGHISLTRLSDIAPVSWTFFKAHPFMVKPEPWTSLPAGFPSYCTID